MGTSGTGLGIESLGGGKQHYFSGYETNTSKAGLPGLRTGQVEET